VSQFARTKMDVTAAELEQELTDALETCQKTA
jgi:hypothetical protein